MTDDRSPVPQLTWMVVSDIERARELAANDLLKDEHHQSVELRENGTLVFTASRADLLETVGEAVSPPERRSFSRERG